MRAITKTDIKLRQATLSDIPQIVALLNRCYRSDEGWTNEADLIGGIRTTEEEIQNVIQDDLQYLFVFPHPQDDSQILGTVAVDFTPIDGKPSAYIGTFSVSPELQGQGIGDALLSAVETFANRHAKAKGLTHLSMSILSERPELLAYYQRRGYALTGETMPFPTDGNNGEPKREDLVLNFLQKSIT
ncbi:MULTISPECIES: GNAT family N-acetyltransferase [unclassified Moraxella]|uniref:GNAT family N-acetyltransferase n=1 Tax=unclassified Moraxella TaxID=2685852 RepID=UPI003AF7C2E1